MQPPRAHWLKNAANSLSRRCFSTKKLATNAVKTWRWFDKSSRLQAGSTLPKFDHMELPTAGSEPRQFKELEELC